MAGMLNPGDKEGAVGVAGDVAKMQRLTHSTTAEGAYGQLSALRRAGVSTSDAASKLVPAADTMTQHGESFGDAAAMAAALTARSGGNERKGIGAYESLAARSTTKRSSGRRPRSKGERSRGLTP